MKKQFGFTINLIPSDAEFYKLALRFNVLMYATLVFLLATRHQWGLTPEFLDLDNFDKSKVTFRGTMGLLALMMGAAYWSQMVHSVLSTLVFVPDDDIAERTHVEIASFNGFLTLVLFLLNLFDLAGLAFLPITPPILLLVFYFTKS